MTSLAAFQDAFVRALDGDPAALEPWIDPESARAGLSVHANTTAKGWADAIAENFPTVLAAVGPEWLTGAALAFAREHPPATARLAAWGDQFPDWLANFGPAAGMRYLPTLARLDWFWREAYEAADAEPLGPDAFLTLSAAAMAATRAELHPSARVGWFADTAPEIWRLTRPPAEPPSELELRDEPQGILIIRPALEVEALPIGEAAFAFLAACSAGASLAEAAAAALAARAPDDKPFELTFAALIDAGCFADLHPIETREASS